MSQRFSGSFLGSEGDLEEEKPLCIYGMYFCGACKNIMTPNKSTGEKLEFDCKQCAKKQVDFTNYRGHDCIIYNKQLKPGSRKDNLTKDFLHDQTMPRVQIQCPDCGCESGIALLTPDEGETCLKIRVMCGNGVSGRCEYEWNLDDDQIIFENKIVSKYDIE